VLLVSPAHSHRLYADFPTEGAKPAWLAFEVFGYSPVDPSAVDLCAYPAAASAPLYNVTLAPGDVLYIPPCAPRPRPCIRPPPQNCCAGRRAPSPDSPTPPRSRTFPLRAAIRSVCASHGPRRAARAGSGGTSSPRCRARRARGPLRPGVPSRSRCRARCMRRTSRTTCRRHRCGSACDGATAAGRARP